MEAGGYPDGPNAARTLDQIREGGALLVATAISRLEECADAVRTGRFDKALGLLQEASNKIAPLASAQQTMGAHRDGTFTLRARDLQEGMNLVHVGTVGNVEIERERSPGSVDDIETVVVTLPDRDERLRFYGDQELMCWFEGTPS